MRQIIYHTHTVTQTISGWIKGATRNGSAVIEDGGEEKKGDKASANAEKPVVQAREKPVLVPQIIVKEKKKKRKNQDSEEKSPKEQTPRSERSSPH